VQLQDDLLLADPDAERRGESVRRAARAIERIRPLAPIATIMRLAPDPAGPEAAESWRAAADEAIARLVHAARIPAGLLAVENGAYDFSIASKTLSRFGLSVCTDIGALYLHGHLFAEHLRSHLFRSRAIHLHMGRDGRTNLSAAAIPVDNLVGLLGQLFE